MRLLVTGGAGFIGSTFVKLSLKAGNHLTVFDALTYAGNMKNLQTVERSKAFEFIHGDVCNLKELEQAIEGAEAIVHFAAESHVDRSINNPSPFISTNCLGVANLCELALKYETPKVIHISTDEVYGSIENKINGLSFCEEDPLNPSSPYSSSKAAGDLIALSYHQTYDLPISIVRPSNAYGPFQYPEKIIPLSITNFLDGKTVPLYGDGLNVRDWCHVEDTCDAIEIVLEKGVSGSIYNAGASNEMTNIDLLNKLLEICETDSSLIDYVADRQGHDRHYSIDSTKMRSIGWSPSREFEQGLEDTVKWYRDNRLWWEPLRNSPK